MLFLKTSAVLYCSFSNTKLQNGDGRGPHDDHKKEQARNEGCGSFLLFLLRKNLRCFICLSKLSLGGLRPVSNVVLLPCRTQLIELNSTLANVFLVSDIQLQAAQTKKKRGFPTGVLWLCFPRVSVAQWRASALVTQKVIQVRLLTGVHVRSFLPGHLYY